MVIPDTPRSRPHGPRRTWAESEALVRDILAREPDISGVELGHRMGVSDTYARKVLAEVAPRTKRVLVAERFPGPTLSQQYPHLMLPVACIKLTRGQCAIIDPEDFGLVAERKWSLDDHGTALYATTNIRQPDGGRTTLRMHVLIAGFLGADHANGYGLDNRRCNLREATRTENAANRGKGKKSGTSRFKGVSWNSRCRRWQAQIGANGHRIHLGWFTAEEEAARAYDVAALEHFGEFAVTNRKLGLLSPGREWTLDEEPNTCCGLPMIYQDIWNVRRYQCQHRSHHPVIYVNLATGETLVDEDGYGPRVIPWHRPDEEG